jgi:hypothetical protein
MMLSPIDIHFHHCVSSRDLNALSPELDSNGMLLLKIEREARCVSGFCLRQGLFPSTLPIFTAPKRRQKRRNWKTTVKRKEFPDEGTGEGFNRFRIENCLQKSAVRAESKSERLRFGISADCFHNSPRCGNAQQAIAKK